MLYIFIGEDTFSLKQALAAIKKSAGEDISGANTTTLEGNNITPEELGNICNTSPFLASKRLVIVDGLLNRFEGKSKATTSKKTSRNNQTKDFKSFAAALTDVPETTIIVLSEGKLSNTNPLMKGLSRKAELRSFPLMRGSALKQWIQKQVSQKGGKITPPAITLLANLVGSDLWAMSNEIDKLVLYIQGRPIDENDIMQITSHAQETSVFTMVDAILAGNVKLAEELLQQLLQRGAAPVQLLTVLSWQMQRLVRARELLSLRVPVTEIQSRLGLPEFAVQKTLEQAKRFTPEKLEWVYDRLLETDLAIKTGKLYGELALTILVAELCQPLKA